MTAFSHNCLCSALNKSHVYFLFLIHSYPVLSKTQFITHYFFVMINRIPDRVQGMQFLILSWKIMNQNIFPCSVLKIIKQNRNRIKPLTSSYFHNNGRNISYPQLFYYSNSLYTLFILAKLTQFSAQMTICSFQRKQAQTKNNYH